MEVANIKQPVFGNWYIENKIGSGSFGTVYKIKREEFGTTYESALKVVHIPCDTGEINTLRSEGMDESSIRSYYKELVQNLINEIRILDLLKGNSNIVGYKDHLILSYDNETRFTILIRMELLTPLNQYLVDHKMNEERVVKLGLDLCNALKLCEKNQIIHRDIKPDNIFISETGDFKLGDFGIARAMEKTASQMSKKGTYPYMAPEVYFNKPYDNRADIYSLGLILYQLLNHNRAPFCPPPPTPVKFSDRESALKRRLTGKTIPLLNIENKRLEKAVLKACHADPDKRYPSAGAFFDDLNACVKDKNGKINLFDSDKTEAATDKAKLQDSRKKQTEDPDFDATISFFQHDQKQLKKEVPTHPVKKNRPTDSFKLFFSHYADFSGRTRRSDYWYSVLFNSIILLVLILLSVVSGAIGSVLTTLYLLAILVPRLAISVRRLHDIGKKDTYVLLSLLPIISSVILAVWFMKDSQEDANQYGENPKYK